MVAETVIPLQNESQPEFAVRFHSTMEKAIPDTDARDAEMMDSWRDARGPSPLDHKASQTFARDHTRRADVPLFVEHTTRDSKGNVIIYDRAALTAVLNRNNKRIADTGDFAPITAGHTPEDSGGQMPDVLGYAGPYRLGMVGNETARYAIFADEWHDKEDVGRLRKLRRRSPEVWMEERMEDRFFDPIAALGAETPRLDMGMTRFSRRYPDAFRHVDRTKQNRPVFVMKYAMALDRYTASAPSSASTFVPSHGDAKKKKPYASETAVNTPEDIQQIIDALMETAPMQFLATLMAEQQGGIDTGVAASPDEVPGMGGDPAAELGGGVPPGGDLGGGDIGGAPPIADPAAGGELAPPVGEEDFSKNYACDDEDAKYMARYMSGECDEEPDDYRKRRHGSKRKYMGDEDEEMEVEDYKRRARKIDAATTVDDLKATVASQDAELAKMRSGKSRAERYSKLTELRRTTAIDVETEIVKCDPSKMNDAAFDVHFTTLKQYARMPVGEPALYTPDVASSPEEIASADHAAGVLRYQKDRQAKGAYLNYEDATAAYDKEQAGKPADVA